MAKATTLKAATKATTTKTATLKRSAKATTKKAAEPRAREVAKGSTGPVTAMGLPLRTWVGASRRAKGGDVRSGRRAFIFAFAKRALDNKMAKTFKSALSIHLNKWQMQMLLESEAESMMFQGAQGPVWVLRGPQDERRISLSAASTLEKSRYARFRDLGGAIVGQLGAYKPEKLILETHGLTLEEERGILIGMELACYSFQENRGLPGKPRRKLPELLIKESSEALTEREVRAAGEVGLAMNIARHYVNLPGGDLNPETYANSVEALFAESDTVSVEVWEGDRLVEERMNLLLAVGQAADAQPRLVHLRYRPAKQTHRKPIAIVGKGITFDSGGLDIKPSAGMRWMKKDMGGSAAALGLAKWAERTELPLPLDIYLALAENAVGAGAFRPGDVIMARSGTTVEITNTDAEGRLVLADAIDVAVSQTGEDQPSAIINIATLTGAIKVALGAEVAGLFSNDDELANLLAECSLAKGDLMWRMPLFQPYRSMLKSSFADMANCSEGGFGGAISAALFLESFVKGVPWAHLDVYSWRDSASGAWAEAGGNGQPVQALVELLSRMSLASAQSEVLNGEEDEA